MSKVEELEEKIGYKFNDIHLLETALTHSSYANENGDGHNKSNERLEFLGDSVLGFITAERFYIHYQKFPEGELTKLRAATVCEKSLSEFARQLGLGEYLLLGKGEICTGGKERPSILADAFEALIAAIYIDGGMDAAKGFVLSYVDEAVKKHRGFKDYKTVLQEIVQKNPGDLLSYEILSENGPPHNRTFICGVFINSNALAKGTGKTKKAADEKRKKLLTNSGNRVKI